MSELFPCRKEQDAVIQFMAVCSEAELIEKFKDEEWRYVADSVFGCCESVISVALSASSAGTLKKNLLAALE